MKLDNLNTNIVIHNIHVERVQGFAMLGDGWHKVVWCIALPWFMAASRLDDGNHVEPTLDKL